MSDIYSMVSDHAKMLAGTALWLLLDLPLAWLLGPATIGLVLATRGQPIGTDYFFGLRTRPPGRRHRREYHPAAHRLDARSP